MERRQADEGARERKLAQIIAGAFAFFALSVAAYAVAEGAHVAAGIIGGGTIAAVVTAFLVARGGGEK